MANHQSSVKRARADLKKKSRNSQYISSVRTAVKKFKMAIASTGIDATKAEQLFRTAQSLLARAAAKNIVHANNASRRIERMAHMLKGLIPSAGGPATGAKTVTAPARSPATKKPAATKTAPKAKSAAAKTVKKSAPAKAKKKK